MAKRRPHIEYNGIPDEDIAVWEKNKSVVPQTPQPQEASGGLGSLASGFTDNVPWMATRSGGGLLGMLNQMGAKMGSHAFVGTSGSAPMISQTERNIMTEKGELYNPDLTSMKSISSDLLKMSRDIRENIKPQDNFLYKLGENLASVGVTMGAGLIGGAVAGVPGAAISAGSAGFALEGGMAYADAVEYGLDENDAMLVGLGVGTINSALEAVAPAKIVGMFSKEAKKKLSQGITKYFLGRVAKQGISTGFTEGLTEGAQEITNLVAETVYKDVKDQPEAQEWLDRIKDSAFWGGVVGTLTGGLGGGFNRPSIQPKEVQKPTIANIEGNPLEVQGITESPTEPVSGLTQEQSVRELSGLKNSAQFDKLTDDITAKQNELNSVKEKLSKKTTPKGKKSLLKKQRELKAEIKELTNERLKVQFGRLTKVVDTEISLRESETKPVEGLTQEKGIKELAGIKPKVSKEFEGAIMGREKPNPEFAKELDRIKNEEVQKQKEAANKRTFKALQKPEQTTAQALYGKEGTIGVDKRKQAPQFKVKESVTEPVKGLTQEKLPKEYAEKPKPSSKFTDVAIDRPEIGDGYEFRYRLSGAKVIQDVDGKDTGWRGLDLYDNSKRQKNGYAIINPNTGEYLEFTSRRGRTEIAKIEAIEHASKNPSKTKPTPKGEIITKELKSQDIRENRMTETPKAKEPWEMTLDELKQKEREIAVALNKEKIVELQEQIKKGKIPAETLANIKLNNETPETALKRLKNNLDEISSDKYWKDFNEFNNYHKESIKQALKQNKPVPKEVLKDYPDLRPKAEKPNQTDMSKIDSWVKRWNELKAENDPVKLNNFYGKVKIALNGVAQGNKVVPEFEALKREIEEYATNLKAKSQPTEFGKKVSIKTSEGKKKSGELVELPFGLKGVLEEKNGVYTLYEHRTGRKAGEFVETGGKTKLDGLNDIRQRFIDNEKFVKDGLAKLKTQNKNINEVKEAIPDKPEGMSLDEFYDTPDKRRSFFEGDLPIKLPLKREKFGASDNTLQGEVNVKPIEKNARANPKTELDKLSNSVHKKSKNELDRPAMEGVYHDAKLGFRVATDAQQMVLIPDGRIKTSKIVDIKSGKQIEHKYPDYVGVFQVPTKTAGTINLKDWSDQLNGLERANKFYDASSPEIRFRVDDGNVQIYFNPELLNNAITSLRNNGVESVEFLHLGKSDRAVYLVDAKGSGKMAMVMPIRTEGGKYKTVKINSKDVTVIPNAFDKIFEGRVKSLESEIQDLKDRIAKNPKEPYWKNRLQDTESELSILKRDKVNQKLAENDFIVSDEQYKQSVKNTQKLQSGFDPTAIADYVKIGTYHLERLARRLPNAVQRKIEWSKQMVSQFGNSIKQFLDRIWNGVVKQKYEGKSIGEVMENISKTSKDNLYKENYDIAKRENSVLFKTADRVRDSAKGTKEFAKTLLEPISTSLKRISPGLFRKIRQYEMNVGKKLIARMKPVESYLESKRKAKLTDYEEATLDLALKNRDFDTAYEILDKYGLRGKFNVIRALFDEIAKDAGIDNKIENYFARAVKKPDEFMEFLKTNFPEYHNIIDKLIKNREESLKGKISEEQKARTISNALRGYNPGIALSDKANMKKRILPLLDGEMSNKFYHSSDFALVKYVTEMTEIAEQRKFFGVKGYDPLEGIGQFVRELADKGEIDNKKINEVVGILKDRFNQRGVNNSAIQLLRDVGVVTKLGNPLSALTQVKDLAQSIKISPKETLSALIEKVTGKKEWTLQDIGFDQDKIAQELSETRGMRKTVDRFLKVSGFKAIDVFGKDVFINTAYKKLRQLAKTDPDGQMLQRRVRDYFGDTPDGKQFIKDLQAGAKTDRVAFALFNELSNVQPISLAEVPRGYLRSGNWRVAYFLKTFNLRQMDMFLNETVRLIKNKQTRKEGFRNLGLMLVSFSVLGSGVDALKDALLGRDTDASETILDNLLSVMMLNRFDYYNLQRGGLAGAIGSKVLPPMDFIQDPFEDIINQLENSNKSLKTMRHIPIVGRFMYEYFKKPKRSSRGGRTSRRGRR